MLSKYLGSNFAPSAVALPGQHFWAEFNGDGRPDNETVAFFSLKKGCTTTTTAPHLAQCATV